MNRLILTALLAVIAFGYAPASVDYQALRDASVSATIAAYRGGQ